MSPTILTTVALFASVTTPVIANSDSAISLITSEVFDIPSGPLVLPPSTNSILNYIGTGLAIDNDGNWYGAFQLGITNSTDTLQFARDVVYTRNGVPFSREGYQLPGSPAWVPQPEEGTRTSGGTPYGTARIAHDGTLAQRFGGVTGFTLRPDGTPDPGSPIPFAPLDTLELGIVDNSVFIIEGQRFGPISSILEGPDSPVPGFNPVDDVLIENLFAVLPVSSDTVYVSAEFQDGPGTFADSVSLFFKVSNPGEPDQAADILFADGDGFIIPDIGVETDSSNDFSEGIETASDGSFVTTIDIDGEPFDEADAVMLFDGQSQTFSIIAQGGDPAPTTDPRTYQFIDTAVAINEDGDVAFVADATGASADDTFIVVNGTVVAREGDTVGTLAPAALQDLTDQFGGRNLELDREGNVIWPGVWSTPDICDGISGSGFGIFNALFFNDQPLIEAGVTEIHDVQIGALFFETLVVKEILNSEAAGFTVSPDGDTLIAAVFAVEPSDEICDYSTNVNTPGQTLIIAVDLEQVRNPTQAPCPGDVNGDRTIDVNDLLVVLQNFDAMVAGGPADGDLDRSGTVDVNDILAVLVVFGATCE